MTIQQFQQSLHYLSTVLSSSDLIDGEFMKQFTTEQDTDYQKQKQKRMVFTCNTCYEANELQNNYLCQDCFYIDDKHQNCDYTTSNQSNLPCCNCYKNKNVSRSKSIVDQFNRFIEQYGERKFIYLVKQIYIQILRKETKLSILVQENQLICRIVSIIVLLDKTQLDLKYFFNILKQESFDYQIIKDLNQKTIRENIIKLLNNSNLIEQLYDDQLFNEIIASIHLQFSYSDLQEIKNQHVVKICTYNAVFGIQHNFNVINDISNNFQQNVKTLFSSVIIKTLLTNLQQITTCNQIVVSQKLKEISKQKSEQLIQTLQFILLMQNQILEVQKSNSNELMQQIQEKFVKTTNTFLPQIDSIISVLSILDTSKLTNLIVLFLHFTDYIQQLLSINQNQEFENMSNIEILGEAGLLTKVVLQRMQNILLKNISNQCIQQIVNLYFKDANYFEKDQTAFYSQFVYNTCVLSLLKDAQEIDQDSTQKRVQFLKQNIKRDFNFLQVQLNLSSKRNQIDFDMLIVNTFTVQQFNKIQIYQKYYYINQLLDRYIGFEQKIDFIVESFEETKLQPIVLIDYLLLLHYFANNHFKSNSILQLLLKNQYLSITALIKSDIFHTQHYGVNYSEFQQAMQNLNNKPNHLILLGLGEFEKRFEDEIQQIKQQDLNKFLEDVVNSITQGKQQYIIGDIKYYKQDLVNYLNEDETQIGRFQSLLNVCFVQIFIQDQHEQKENLLQLFIKKNEYTNNVIALFDNSCPSSSISKSQSLGSKSLKERLTKFKNLSNNSLMVSSYKENCQEKISENANICCSCHQELNPKDAVVFQRINTCQVGNFQFPDFCTHQYHDKCVLQKKVCSVCNFSIEEQGAFLSLGNLKQMQIQCNQLLKLIFLLFTKLDYKFESIQQLIIREIGKVKLLMNSLTDQISYEQLMIQTASTQKFIQQIKEQIYECQDFDPIVIFNQLFELFQDEQQMDINDKPIIHQELLPKSTYSLLKQILHNNCNSCHQKLSFKGKEAGVRCAGCLQFYHFGCSFINSAFTCGNCSSNFCLHLPTLNLISDKDCIIQVNYQTKTIKQLSEMFKNMKPIIGQLPQQQEERLHYDLHSLPSEQKYFTDLQEYEEIKAAVLTHQTNRQQLIKNIIFRQPLQLHERINQGVFDALVQQFGPEQALQMINDMQHIQHTGGELPQGGINANRRPF